MPYWHHHCGCPYHHHGHRCPWCDGPGYERPMREPWPAPEPADAEGISRELAGLREAVERLNDRIDALEAE